MSMAGCGRKDRVATSGLATSLGCYGFSPQNYTMKSKSDMSKQKLTQTYAHLQKIHLNHKYFLLFLTSLRMTSIIASYHVKEKVPGDILAHFNKALVFAELISTTLAHVLGIPPLTLGQKQNKKFGNLGTLSSWLSLAHRESQKQMVWYRAEKHGLFC